MATTNPTPRNERPARRTETRMAQLQRLARKAGAENLTYEPLILDNDKGAQWYAISSSAGNGSYVVYVVDDAPGRCTCRGYQKHGACKHYGMALVVAGLLKLP